MNEDEIRSKLSEINITQFIMKEDAKLGFGELDRQIRDAYNWSKKFMRSGLYRSQLPAPRREAADNAMVDFIRQIERFNETRETDPTGFMTSRHQTIEELQQALGYILTEVIEPYRSYLVYSRASEFVDDIETSKDKAEEAVSAKQEAALDVAVNVHSKAFNDLADTFQRKRRWWLGGLITYIIVVIFSVCVIYNASETLRLALKDFDPSNIAAYIFKIVVLSIFAIVLNFILKNYNSCFAIEVNAHTRATRLKTWRAFISTPEINHDTEIIQRAKAEIAADVARIMFSDIALPNEKSRTKILEAPVNITTKTN